MIHLSEWINPKAIGKHKMRTIDLIIIILLFTVSAVVMIKNDSESEPAQSNVQSTERAN